MSIEVAPEPVAHGRLRIGFYLPTFTGGLDGRTPRWAEMRDIVRLAEDVGFDSVWLPDELLWRFEGEPTIGFWECWTLVAAIAAATTRIEIGTLVACTNYRSPALLAKMAEAADEVSGGRLRLGLGAGWSSDQFRAFGAEPEQLVSRFDEALTIIRCLLRDGHATFTGRHYRVLDCVLEPRGPRPGRIPILVGALGPRMMQLAARDGDAWNAFLVRRGSAGEIPPLREALDAACREIGRDPTTLARSAAVIAAYGDSPVRIGPSDWTERALRGSPDELAEQMAAFGREGVDELQVGVIPTTPANVEEFARSLELLERGPRDRERDPGPPVSHRPAS